MRIRVSSLALCLSVAACGGSSRRADADEGRNGGTGALDGGGTESGGAGQGATGGAGQGATGGSSVGGSGASASDPLSGDYWIVTDPGQVIFVTVTSPTKALVGGEFERGYEYDIIHTPREPLAPDAGSYAPDTGLTGEFVLRNAVDPRAVSEFAIEGDGNNARARIGFRSQSCLGQERFVVVAGTARRDIDPPVSRITPGWGIVPPWPHFSVETRRPVLAPLSADFSLTADGAPLDVNWGESAERLVSSAEMSVADWTSAIALIGRSLELRGTMHGTNGTESSLLETIDVPDWGMHEGPVSFASSETPVVALWGGATHVAPGMAGVCSDGCVVLTYVANVGMRFIRPGTFLRVTAIFNRIELELWSADGRGMIVHAPDGAANAVETKDIAIPFETDDLLVIFRGPGPIFAGGCPTPANIAYLVSVEPEGEP